MELELKHLAPYLPYGLEVEYLFQTIVGNIEKRKSLLLGMSAQVKVATALLSRVDKNNNVISSVFSTQIKEIKPILHPLSDLTKEIKHNGEMFCPYTLLEIDSSIVDFVSANNQPIIRLVDCEFIYAIDVYNNIINKLFEWHFDVFNLIPNNLAIDINTLK